MVDPFSTDAFYASGREFALSALEATTSATTGASLLMPEPPWSTWQRHAWHSGHPRFWLS
jgi:hypothetical protein